MPKNSLDKKTIYQRDLPPELVNEIWGRFERALLPLDSAGKLGVVMFQFPPWFYPGDEQREYIRSCQARLQQTLSAVNPQSVVL